MTKTKQHRWKPGTMVKIAGPLGGTAPLFKNSKGSQLVSIHIANGTPVMYIDIDGEKQGQMIQIIFGEIIGWTYWDCVATIRESQET